MKILNKNNSVKRNVIIGLVVVILLVGVCFILDRLGVVKIFPKTDPLPTLSELPSDQEKETEASNGNFTKQELLDSTKDSSGSQDVTVPVPTTNENIELSANKEGREVIIIVKLKERGFSDGKCTLTVSANSKSISQSAIIIYQPEYSTCSGFSVPLSDLGGGTWNISVSITPTGGSSISKNLTKEF